MISLPTICPVTVCPLFAAAGSVWTGIKNGNCLGSECGWYHGGSCEATVYAIEGAAMCEDKVAARSFDCQHAAQCQWQQQSSGLCPPRRALAEGIDPRSCRW